MSTCEKFKKEKFRYELKKEYSTFFRMNYSIEKPYILKLKNFESEEADLEYFFNFPNQFGSYVQKSFTDEEAEKIRLPKGMTLDMFDKVKVDD